MEFDLETFWYGEDWDDWNEEENRIYVPKKYKSEILGTKIGSDVLMCLFGVPDYRAMDQRWTKACLESFKNIPELPEPKKISEIAKEMNTSTREVKKYLNEGWIELNKWFWIKATPEVLHIINVCQKKDVKPSQVILAINRLKKFLKEGKRLDPSRKGLTKVIGINALNLLVRIKFLVGLRLLSGSTVYYVSSTFWNL